VAMEHYKARSRLCADHGAGLSGQQLNAAFEEAEQAVPGDLLLRALHSENAPSASSMFALRRRLTTNVGLNSLLNYAFSLRCDIPHSIVLRRDLGTAELLDFAPAIGFHASPSDGVPFRLTRTMQNYISPLNIHGAFVGAMCAAAECFANQSKCPVEFWLNALSHGDAVLQPTAEGTAFGPPTEAIVPWSADGQTAARRVVELSPAEIARAATAVGGDAGGSVDAATTVRDLVGAATRLQNLVAMPSSYEAWL
jgi:hypothetical protein